VQKETVGCLQCNW